MTALESKNSRDSEDPLHYGQIREVGFKYRQNAITVKADEIERLGRDITHTKLAERAKTRSLKGDTVPGKHVVVISNLGNLLIAIDVSSEQSREDFLSDAQVSEGKKLRKGNYLFFELSDEDFKDCIEK